MKVIIAIIALLFTVGCATYLPPERPVAYMYPSIVPGGVLRTLQPAQVPPEELQKMLEECHLQSALAEYGLLEMEYQTLSRGLARHGYGEIDARRCNRELKWVRFQSSNHTMEVIWLDQNGLNRRTFQR